MGSNIFNYSYFQNPGFDFSGAKLDKQYEDKGVKQMENAVNSLNIKKSWNQIKIISIWLLLTMIVVCILV